METLTDLMEYLDDRGAKYGIDGSEIYERIPETVRGPRLAYDYMQMKDISHITPLSEGGDPAGDNWILEDSSVNRARGAEQMSDTEVAEAKRDGMLDARQLSRTALAGGALTVGGAIAEGAIVAAEGAAVAVETIAVIPTILTVAAIGGAGYLLYRAFKK